MDGEMKDSNPGSVRVPPLRGSAKSLSTSAAPEGRQNLAWGVSPRSEKTQFRQAAERRQNLAWGVNPRASITQYCRISGAPNLPGVSTPGSGA